MKAGIILQARTGSQRLRGKVLEPIAKQLVINPMRKQAVIGRSRTTLLRIHT